MIFRATLRRTGSFWSGHVDDAHAAFADLLMQLVGADLGAGAFGDGAWSMVAAMSSRSISESAARSVVLEAMPQRAHEALDRRRRPRSRYASARSGRFDLDCR